MHIRKTNKQIFTKTNQKPKAVKMSSGLLFKNVSRYKENFEYFLKTSYIYIINKIGTCWDIYTKILQIYIVCVDKQKPIF